MVKVDVLDPNTEINYNYYMDGRLNREIDRKIIPSLNQKDEDWVAGVDGEERSGKSVLAMQLAKRVDPTFNLSRMCLSVDEFKRAILDAKPRQAVIFDEAYRGYSAKGALSEVNRILESMMMEMGQKNLFVIVVLPTFFLMSRYVALFRMRGLFHVYKNKHHKGFWRYYNRKNKRKLWLKGKKDLVYPIRTRFKGRFVDYYTLDEKEYRKKKAESFNKGFRVSKDQTFIIQRNKLIYAIYQEYGIKLDYLVELCKEYSIKLKKSTIAAIIAKYRPK